MTASATSPRIALQMGLVVLVLYWGVCFWLLRWQFPVYMDGEGGGPSLWWGRHPPAVSPGEYADAELWYDTLFALQHAGTALVMAVLGIYVAPTLSRQSMKGVRRPFMSAALIAFLFFMLIWIVADVGSRYGLWQIGVLWPPSLHLLTTLFLVVVPPSLLSGLIGSVQSKSV